MKTSNYLLTLLVVSLSCIAGDCITVEAPSPPAPVFNHYWLVQTWPFGYCSNVSNHCIFDETLKKFSYFTLHGLWPVDARGASIEASNAPKINANKVLRSYPELKRQMKQDWPSLNRAKEDKELWEHEYEKHGYASPCLKEPLNYFNTSDNLYRNTNLLKVLKDGKIIPDVGTYTKASFDTALRAKFGQSYNFIYKCTEKNGVSLLSELVICVDENAENFISCDGSLEKWMYKNLCPERFQFPKERVSVIESY